MICTESWIQFSDGGKWKMCFNTTSDGIVWTHTTKSNDAIILIVDFQRLLSANESHSALVLYKLNSRQRKEILLHINFVRFCGIPWFMLQFNKIFVKPTCYFHHMFIASQMKCVICLKWKRMICSQLILRVERKFN